MRKFSAARRRVAPCGPGSHGGAEPPAEHRFGIASRWQIRARSVARATVADLCAGRRDQRNVSISLPVRHRAPRARSGRREPAQGPVRLGGRVRARRAHGISRRSCSQQWPGPPCWLSGHLRRSSTRVGVSTWSVVRAVYTLPWLHVHVHVTSIDEKKNHLDPKVLRTPSG